MAQLAFAAGLYLAVDLKNVPGESGYPSWLVCTGKNYYLVVETIGLHHFVGGSTRPNIASLD